MGTRILAILFAVAGVVYACTPKAHNVERTAVAATVRASLASTMPAPASAAAPAPVTTTVGAGDSVMHATLLVRDGSPRELVLAVTNTGRKLTELRFPDGQTHDFIVRDAADREVWRWSAGRLFTQALRTRPIERGETVEFSERLRATGLAGTYTVVAQLRSDNHPLEVRQAITLP